MSVRVAVLLSALILVISGSVAASPLEDLAEAPVSALEFGGFKLEVALSEIKDWPFPIEGAGVFSQLNPDQLEISVGVSEARGASFRTICSKTLERVRNFFKVDANGVPLVGRSFLSSYFRGPWHGAERETALRALDTVTIIKILVVGGGSCQAALTQAPITFNSISPK